MNKAIRLMAATIAVVGAVGIAQAQGGGSGGAGGGAGGSGTPAAGNGTPGSGGTPMSPTSGTNNGMSSGKTSATTNTGNSADTGPNARSTPPASHTKAKMKKSHAKRADTQMDPASGPMAPNNANN